MIGYALGNDIGFLQLAHYGGVYILSLCAATINTMLWVILTKRWSMIPRYVVYSIGSLFCIGYIVLYIHPFPIVHTNLRVATMTTDFPATFISSVEDEQDETTVILQNLTRYSQQSSQPDIIILPESTLFLTTLEQQGVSIQALLNSLFPTHEVLLIATTRIEGHGGAHEPVVFISSTRGEIMRRDKRLLVPGGEFLPYASSFIFNSLGFGAHVTSVEQNRTYTAGPEPLSVDFRGHSIIALACSEVLSPDLYYRTAYNTTNPILINLSSQSVFHNGVNPFYELQAMTHVHAVWSGAPYYQSTNGAPEIRIE
jgi:apolipoprotein N-acyltransferase